jgi:hypothetical protein
MNIVTKMINKYQQVEFKSTLKDYSHDQMGSVPGIKE